MEEVLIGQLDTRDLAQTHHITQRHSDPPSFRIKKFSARILIETPSSVSLLEGLFAHLNLPTSVENMELVFEESVQLYLYYAVSQIMDHDYGRLTRFAVATAQDDAGASAHPVRPSAINVFVGYISQKAPTGVSLTDSGYSDHGD